MKVIESKIEGKKSPESCEDGLVVTADFIAVIDGSTSKTPHHLSPDMKNGRYAMVLISEYIQHELKPESTVEDFCEGVTSYIYNKVYRQQGIEEQMQAHPEERLTASAILYSKAKNEVWMVGDCQAIIDGKLYENNKPFEDIVARRRVELIRQGFTPQEARKTIEPLLIQAMLEGQNKTYTVIDGFPIYQKGMKVVSLNAPQKNVETDVADSLPLPTKEIVLASDGYPFLKPTLTESEEALAHLLAYDPQCTHEFIATKGIVVGNKSFDDRTYIRFQI
ncbi:putative uncharacterized protein [Prevotella sp. CAG:732]|uniref:hypothetical protein n=1 Tax=Prevotella sp. TaxID=59823 RepID=UPI00033E4B82|nr:hypothetical protein [Prevotella sp. CAG:732]CDD21071.1 putative uncharacterized protein [Prevotella sp. CAG:732]